VVAAKETIVRGVVARRETIRNIVRTLDIRVNGLLLLTFETAVGFT
jgi:hypothetical protein